MLRLIWYTVFINLSSWEDVSAVEGNRPSINDIISSPRGLLDSRTKNIIILSLSGRTMFHRNLTIHGFHDIVFPSRLIDVCCSYLRTSCCHVANVNNSRRHRQLTQRHHTTRHRSLSSQFPLFSICRPRRLIPSSHPVSHFKSSWVTEWRDAKARRYTNVATLSTQTTPFINRHTGTVHPPAARSPSLSSFRMAADCAYGHGRWQDRRWINGKCALC